jgi:NAD(P)-dependent dehydrogenase (short-subunit alcohol dehydrogenase family)
MLADRPIAIVTGANRGIGREVTRQLAAAGFAVLLGSRDLAAGQTAAHQIDSGGNSVTACQLDVTDPASVTALASFATEHFGCVDVLVNNAAIHYDTWQHAADRAVPGASPVTAVPRRGWPDHDRRWFSANTADFRR